MSSTLDFPDSGEASYTWDDGIGYRPAGATDPIVNRPSASFAPESVSSGAGSWDDVLKFGLSRIIDAKTRPVAPENTAPVLVSDTGKALAVNLPKWVLLGAAAIVGVLLLSKMRSG